MVVPLCLAGMDLLELIGTEDAVVGMTWEPSIQNPEIGMVSN